MTLGCRHPRAAAFNKPLFPALAPAARSGEHGCMGFDIDVELRPFATLGYRNAVEHGRSEDTELGFYRARAAWLPPQVEGLVITSDLQGIVPHPHTGEPQLMGLAVVEKLVELYLDGHLPQPVRRAAILAGDFFALPDRRGGFGCVAEVWQAFADNFAHVIGVAGNHDNISRIRHARHVHLLDSSDTTLGGLRIGGVGLIMGNARKPGRREDQDQYQRLEAMAGSRPDILLLHEGPPGGPGQPGLPVIGGLMEGHQIPLTIRGHKAWNIPVFRAPHGVVLNVHERVIVVERG